MPRRSLFVIGLSLALLLAGAPAGEAAQTVWSGLVIASNAAEPDEIPPELHRVEGTLKALFGYNQFKLIGQSQNALATGAEDWLASSKYFALHVDAKGETKTGYLVKLQLFQEKNLLLETETNLNKASPLVIKGPQVGAGQLVLVLIVQ